MTVGTRVISLGSPEPWIIVVVDDTGTGTAAGTTAGAAAGAGGGALVRPIV